VVEDDDGVRNLAVTTVREMGFEALAAGSGSEAMKLLFERPDIRLLVSDVAMSGMTGPELVSEALKLRPDLKVLFASGYDGDELEEIEELPRFIDLISKPFTRKELREKLTRAVQEGRRAA
jgi:CheY-like chemotaxis protein